MKNFIVLDEFYDEPDYVRNLALTSEWPKPSSAATYPGRNSASSYYDEFVNNAVSEAVGQKLKPSEGQMNGGFRISLKGDTYKQDIHVDPMSENIWAGVLCLSKPEDCVDENGYPIPMTVTWRHKELGWQRIPLNKEEGLQYGYDTYQKIHNEIIEVDGIDRSKWVPTNLTYMEYNKMVIFRPWMFHSAGVADGLGTNLENGRLMQIFFWSLDE